eukprot:s3523_g6.t1
MVWSTTQAVEVFQFDKFGLQLEERPNKLEMAVSEPRVSGGDFGLGDEDLTNLKEQAVVITRAKKPKLTHQILFQDNGLKKVIRDFPKLKFQGKGHEFEDLKVLMAAYKKWLKELYPFKDDFEEVIWKAREVLQKKEQTDTGEESDPRHHLHMLRLHYKKNKVAENRSGKHRRTLCFIAHFRVDLLVVQCAAADVCCPAINARQQVQGPVRMPLDKIPRRQSGRDAQVAENRAKALERKRQREAQAQLQPDIDDEDAFGFGAPEMFEDVFDFGDME